ncbi:uncharacterized [Tachysurus ichikawai]
MCRERAWRRSACFAFCYRFFLQASVKQRGNEGERTAERGQRFTVKQKRFGLNVDDGSTDMRVGRDEPGFPAVLPDRHMLLLYYATFPRKENIAEGKTTNRAQND